MDTAHVALGEDKCSIIVSSLEEGCSVGKAAVEDSSATEEEPIFKEDKEVSWPLEEELVPVLEQAPNPHKVLLTVAKFLSIGPCDREGVGCGHTTPISI